MINIVLKRSGWICQFNVVIIMFSILQYYGNGVLSYDCDFYQVQSLFSCCKHNKRKACTSCLVGFRSSEHSSLYIYIYIYIYNLVTVVSLAKFIYCGKEAIGDLCQLRRYGNQSIFLM